MEGPVGRPPAWRGPLTELERVETDDPAVVLDFLASHHLAGEPLLQRGDVGVALLVGARGCALLGGVPQGRPSPVAVPECVAVAYRRDGSLAPEPAGAQVGEWVSSWTDAEHARAVEQVRQAIACGDVYQANVVGHRSAPFGGDPAALATALTRLPGAWYGGSLTGPGWTVASASPEQLVRVTGDRVATVPIKGTSPRPDQLRASVKDRAEHVMIVDLERNDLARVTQPGTVTVEELYALSEWAGLWHASSTVAGRLVPGVGVTEVLRALLPGGSVTGAPKHAACALLAGLEPVGRGPAMGAMGFVWPGGLDLGLTIRTIAAADGRVHLWAGGGITWGSDPDAEVAEAHAKAGPVQRALAQVRPSSS
ncbi:MAG: Para-aminobenzoate synthetase component 1 [Frankiales bacterium]|nr:Para-aminobenzoate synthetase component 1 [Frankiales bacterium]